MKNLKKTLAVVLAFAMILSMGAISTLAYSDVAEGTVVSEAVEILSNLNILKGYEDGTFQPSKTVTRAEMATIICRMLGYEDQAASSKGATVFEDVAADHWASGYINVAQSQQIINGYRDGNFGPEDQVTYEQAVKMIVASLGYDLAAGAKGGYPTGYLAIASSKGITKNANGRVGDAATRSSIAVLVYNALEVELMDQTSWSSGTAGNEYGMTGETVLSRYLGVKKIEGVVNTTPLTSLVENAYDPESSAYVAFESVKEWKFENKSYVLKDATNPGAINADLVADADQYLGKKVVAYVGTEADAATGEVMIYAMAEKQGANAAISFNAIQLVENDEADKLYYKKAGSNKKYDVKLNLDTVFVNYDELDVSDLETEVEEDSEADYVSTMDIMAVLENGGTIELIDSDATQNGYESAIIVTYDSEAVVEEVEVDGADIYFTTYVGELDDIDTESETDLTVVYKDGAVVEATAIAAGDTVSVVEIGDSVDVLYVSSKNVTGSVDGWDEEAVTIAGEEYVPSVLSEISLAELQNVEGIFYLNVDGQIAYFDGSAAKGGYAFFLNTGKDAGMGSKYYATIVEANGEVKAYNYAKNVTINGVSKTAEEAHDAIAALMGDVVSDTEAYATVDTAADLVFEVTIKNGEIKKLVNVDYTTPDETVKYNADRKAFGAKTLDETTVMFALAGAYDDDAKIEEEDIKVGKAVEMLVDEEEYYVALSTDARENSIYKAAIGYALVTAVSMEGEIIVITGKKTVSYNDDVATVIEGIQGGKEVKITLYNEDGFRSNDEFDAADLAIGDIILTSTVTAEGVADDFTVVLDKSEEEVLVENNEEKDLYFGFQIATGAETDYITFEDEMAGITETDGVTFMEMQKGVNTVLVDYTEDETEPEIGKKTLSKTLIGRADKYASYVFVRVIDEEIVDVVVYKYELD